MVCEVTELVQLVVLLQPFTQENECVLTSPAQSNLILSTWESPQAVLSCREPSTPRCWSSVSASTSATTYVNANSSTNNTCTSSVPWWCGIRASTCHPTCPAGAALQRQCPWGAPTCVSHRATRSSFPIQLPATVPVCPLHLLIPAPPAPSPPPSPPAIICLARAWWEM